MAIKESGRFSLSGSWKRTGTALKNQGNWKINDNALVALALLVAQSNPDDKELMAALVVNMIKG